MKKKKVKKAKAAKKSLMKRQKVLVFPDLVAGKFCITDGEKPLNGFELADLKIFQSKAEAQATLDAIDAEPHTVVMRVAPLSKFMATHFDIDHTTLEFEASLREKKDAISFKKALFVAKASFKEDIKIFENAIKNHQKDIAKIDKLAAQYGL